jgi:hypothetical protein
VDEHERRPDVADLTVELEERVLAERCGDRLEAGDQPAPDVCPLSL